MDAIRITNHGKTLVVPFSRVGTPAPDLAPLWRALSSKGARERSAKWAAEAIHGQVRRGAA